MPRRIHVDHGVDRGAEQQRMPALLRPIGHEDAALLRREGLWVAVDTHDVLIARQRPEAGAVRALALPRHGRPRAQPREELIWLAFSEFLGLREDVLVDLRIDFWE